MTDFWVKITEKEDEEIRRHHYLVTAENIADARKVAQEFIKHFCDEDDEPETIADGFAFCNRAAGVIKPFATILAAAMVAAAVTIMAP